MVKFISTFILAAGLMMTNLPADFTGINCGHCGSPTAGDTEPYRCDDCLHKHDQGGEG